MQPISNAIGQQKRKKPCKAGLSRIAQDQVGLDFGAPGRDRTSTPFGQQILSLPRLPIPPQGQASMLLAFRPIKINRRRSLRPDEAVIAD
jgi:hypothetical protein